MTGKCGTMVVNMKQFGEKWPRDPETDRMHQKIAASKGIFYTTDISPYCAVLDDVGILYQVR